MTTLKLSRTSPARTARTRGLGARIADRVRALTRYCRAASPSPTERTITILDDVCELRPRNHGRLREHLRYAVKHDCICVGLDTGVMRRSMRLGENYGINALTGVLTAWIPAPEEVEFEQEWPSKWEPYGLLEYHEDEE